MRISLVLVRIDSFKVAPEPPVRWMGGVSVLVQGQLQDSLVLPRQQVERKHDYKVFAVKTVVSVGRYYVKYRVLKRYFL